MPTTVHGPAWTTVTGTALPSSVNTCVIPTLRPRSPSLRAMTLQLDLDVDACGEVELHEGVDGLRGRVDDVDQALVRPHLELLARGFVDVRRAEDRPAVDHRGKQDRARDPGTRAANGLHDLLDRAVEELVVVRLQA